METAGGKSGVCKPYQSKIAEKRACKVGYCDEHLCRAQDNCNHDSPKSESRNQHENGGARLRIEHIFSPGNKPAYPSDRVRQPARIACREVEKVSRNKMPGQKYHCTPNHALRGVSPISPPRAIDTTLFAASPGPGHKRAPDALTEIGDKM